MYGQMPYQNPLTAFHNILRMGAPAGYPNTQYYAPHPYELTYAAGVRPANSPQFQYSQGRDLQMQVGPPPRGPMTPVRTFMPINSRGYIRRQTNYGYKPSPWNWYRGSRR